ncbi:MAG TPA: methionyl-tRNA formyltransferase, partial [Mycobacteriales bacterium]|nr:methionyl-tRNA formyltransferase [Mycobacteriales bacterium]
DVRVDWTAPAMRVDRLVRAATPTPGAWTTFRDRRLKLGPVRPGSGPPGLAPGAVADLGTSGVVVGTATGPVTLTTVQPEGKGVMDASAWARGVRLTDSDRLV